MSRVKNFKAKKFAKDLFACDCGYWIHEDCDPLLKRNPVNLSRARTKDTTYNCPKCRSMLKNRQAALFVDLLIRLDLNNLFTQVNDLNQEIDRDKDYYYRTITNPMFLSTMLRKARAGFYEADMVSRLRTDYDQLWKNIQTFNMPNTPEFLEGYKFYILANFTFNEFSAVLQRTTEDYLFDDNLLFVTFFFYPFKSKLCREYLNLLAKDYYPENNAQVGAVFEERDKRPITSKERNKMHHLLSVKKMKALDLDDLYEYERLSFDLESKSLVVELKGVNMINMDYSEVDLSQASHPLRNFVKTHGPHLKRSVAKNLSEMADYPLALAEQRGSIHGTEEIDEAFPVVLNSSDFQLMTQLEYWLIEHRDTVDSQFYLSDILLPTPCKTACPSDVSSIACLLLGTLTQLTDPLISELIMCRQCGEAYTKELLFPRQPTKEIDWLDYLCPSCMGCQICRGKQYSFIPDKGYLRETSRWD